MINTTGKQKKLHKREKNGKQAYLTEMRGKEFITVVHVAEDWVVDECGNFRKVRESGVCVVAWPDDGNTWTCANCGAEAVIIE